MASHRVLPAFAGLVAVVVAGYPPPMRSAAAAVRQPRPHVCAPALPSQRPLAGVATTMVALPGNPFGVVTTASGAWAFVSTSSGAVAAFDDRGRRPRLVRELALPGALPAGDALTRDGRYLLVADGSGVDVVDVARLERGSPRPVVGTLAVDRRSTSVTLDSAIEVTVSPDDRFAFVSLESANEIAVFDLRRALESGFSRSALVGTIRLGLAVVGMAISPDGRWLYATSEARSASSLQGTISVVDLERAETRPGRSVVGAAAAGCDPVRVAVSPDGSVVWVTARESNSLLAFSAPRLRTDPRHALLARVRVGAAPVGLALLRHGTRIVVADSDRFAAARQTAALTVVDAEAALARRPAVVGEIATGAFPRELSLDTARNRLLVTDFGSGQLEVVDLRHLP